MINPRIFLGVEEINELLKQDFEKRRIQRIIQVREKAKIHSRYLCRVYQNRQRALYEKYRLMEQNRLLHEKTLHLMKLQNALSAQLKEIGSSHNAALLQTDISEQSKIKSVINEVHAKNRLRAAVNTLKKNKSATFILTMKTVNARLQLRSDEKKRSIKIISRPLKENPLKSLPSTHAAATKLPNKNFKTSRLHVLKPFAVKEIKFGPTATELASTINTQAPIKNVCHENESRDSRRLEILEQMKKIDQALMKAEITAKYNNYHEYLLRFNSKNNCYQTGSDFSVGIDKHKASESEDGISSDFSHNAVSSNSDLITASEKNLPESRDICNTDGATYSAAKHTSVEPFVDQLPSFLSAEFGQSKNDAQFDDRSESPVTEISNENHNEEKYVSLDTIMLNIAKEMTCGDSNIQHEINKNKSEYCLENIVNSPEQEINKHPQLSDIEDKGSASFHPILEHSPVCSLPIEKTKATNLLSIAVQTDVDDNRNTSICTISEAIPLESALETCASITKDSQCNAIVAVKDQSLHELSYNSSGIDVPESKWKDVEELQSAKNYDKSEALNNLISRIRSQRAERLRDDFENLSDDLSAVKGSSPRSPALSSTSNSLSHNVFITDDFSEPSHMLNFESQSSEIKSRISAIDEQLSRLSKRKKEIQEILIEGDSDENILRNAPCQNAIPIFPPRISGNFLQVVEPTVDDGDLRSKKLGDSKFRFGHRPDKIERNISIGHLDTLNSNSRNIDCPNTLSRRSVNSFSKFNASNKQDYNNSNGQTNKDGLSLCSTQSSVVYSENHVGPEASDGQMYSYLCQNYDLLNTYNSFNSCFNKAFDDKHEPNGNLSWDSLINAKENDGIHNSFEKGRESSSPETPKFSKFSKKIFEAFDELHIALLKSKEDNYFSNDVHPEKFDAVTPDLTKSNCTFEDSANLCQNLLNNKTGTQKQQGFELDNFAPLFTSSFFSTDSHGKDEILSSSPKKDKNSIMHKSEISSISEESSPASFKSKNVFSPKQLHDEIGKSHSLLSFEKMESQLNNSLLDLQYSTSVFEELSSKNLEKSLSAATLQHKKSKRRQSFSKTYANDVIMNEREGQETLNEYSRLTKQPLVEKPFNSQKKKSNADNEFNMLPDFPSFAALKHKSCENRQGLMHNSNMNNEKSSHYSFSKLHNQHGLDESLKIDPTKKKDYGSLSKSSIKTKKREMEQRNKRLYGRLEELKNSREAPEKCEHGGNMKGRMPEYQNRLERNRRSKP